VAKPDWAEPLDPAYAQEYGGRWNPPGSFATLYLNGDVRTALLQVERMLQGSPAGIDDLADHAFTLVAATLPRDQTAADAVSAGGLAALELPGTYPLDSDAAPVPHSQCQPIGQAVHDQEVRGVWCRSACTPDGSGRELAWFPASSRSRANAIWPDPRPLSDWREARTWADLGLADQADPHP